MLQSAAGILFLAAMSALCKALSLQSTADMSTSASSLPAEQKKGSASKDEGSVLTERQQVLLGMSGGKQKGQIAEKVEVSDSTGVARHRPPRTRTSASPSQTSLLVPVHSSVSAKNGRGSNISTSAWTGVDWGEAGKVSPVGSMQSPPYVCLTQNQTSPVDSHLSPWAKHASPLLKDDISSQQKLEEFLADVDDKLVESSVKIPNTVQTLLTPPPTLRGVSITTPTSGQTPSSASKGTPVRALRISPSPQKFGPSPRKGEGDLPPPMSPEHAIEAFEKLGIYPQIEQWRDQLRQWFSKDLLNSLVLKIDLSHLQVMQAAAKLGISINVSPVGGSKIDTAGTSQSSVDTPAQDWVSTFSPDEDALLHQLRVYLVQARDAPPSKLGLCVHVLSIVRKHVACVLGMNREFIFHCSSMFIESFRVHANNNFSLFMASVAPQSSMFATQPSQVWPVNPAIQECLDAVSEHQRLKALMKGEWAKGLLPQSSVRADYTVQRIRGMGSKFFHELFFVLHHQYENALKQPSKICMS